MITIEKYPIPVREFLRFLTDWILFMRWLFTIIRQNSDFPKGRYQFYLVKCRF